MMWNTQSLEVVKCKLDKYPVLDHIERDDPTLQFHACVAEQGDNCNTGRFSRTEFNLTSIPVKAQWHKFQHWLAAVHP